MESFRKDLFYAVRGLRKRPGFTLVALLTLSLGIGANASIFSVVNAVLLRSLKFKDPERLAVVWEEATFAGFPTNTPAPANFVDWKLQNQSFEDMAALASSSFNLAGDGEPLRISTYAVTANLFPILGVQPLLGRSFTTEDDQPGANKVAILSYQLWQTRYGGVSDIVNRAILLNGEKYTVIGVMPRDFQFFENYVRMWVPLALDKEEMANRGAHYLTVVARLKPGLTVSQAQADMSTLMTRIDRDHPDESFNGKLGVVVVPLQDQLVGDSRRPLLVLLIAVGFVLLIACANVAGLLLARAVGRRREIALRLALGASRLRIIRQLLTESLLLAFLGGAIGVLLAVLSFTFLEKLIPATLTLSTHLHLDLKLLLFSLLVSVLTGVIFGLVPAIQTAKVDLNEALKQTSTRATSTGRLRSSIIVFEVALAIVLLVGAGLLVQTLYRLFNQYSGMEPEKVLTLRTVLPRAKYAEPAKRNGFYKQVLDRIEHLPGVVSAGYTTSVPLSWKGGTSGFYPEGAMEAIPGMSYDANHRQVSNNYLKTMKIPLLQGRYFTPQDSEKSLPVVIVNETMARQYWPGQTVVGRRLKLGDPADDIPWFEIVGVAADVRQMGLDEPVKAEMYFPYQQITAQPWFMPRDLAIRTSGDPTAIVAAVRQIVKEVDPAQPISNVATMSELLGEEAGQRRLGMLMLVTFSGLALLLAAIGIYGVLAYFVSQYTSEIGVRMALGASQWNILLLILKKGMSLTLVGIAVGLIASFAITRFMSSLLFEVRALDPLTFMLAPVVIGIAAFCASFIPARRAIRVDPVVALRCE
jgi:predicted permease